MAGQHLSFRKRIICGRGWVCGPRGTNPGWGCWPACGNPPGAPQKPGAVAEARPGLSLQSRGGSSPREQPQHLLPCGRPSSSPWRAGGQARRAAVACSWEVGLRGSLSSRRSTSSAPALAPLAPSLPISPKLSISRGSPGSDVGGRRCRCHPGRRLRSAQPVHSAGVLALGRWAPPCSLRTDNKRRVAAN